MKKPTRQTVRYLSAYTACTVAAYLLLNLPFLHEPELGGNVWLFLPMFIIGLPHQKGEPGQETWLSCSRYPHSCMPSSWPPFSSARIWNMPILSSLVLRSIVCSSSFGMPFLLQTSRVAYSRGNLSRHAHLALCPGRVFRYRLG